MIWLASFPRSGNTFLRNILFEVYGLESSTFHRESDYPLDANFANYPFVKTHQLPSNLESEGLDANLPAVLLVRDGRDAICSMAHHRADLIKPESDYYQNVMEAIVAEKGSFFGGWSHNVEEWLKRAQLIIRFEDLILEPLKAVERIRQLYDLPKPDARKLPTFEAMKFGIPQYGAGRQQNISDSQKHENARKFFRRGEAGNWRKEMPVELQDLFWSYHGEAMSRFGYGKNGIVVEPNPDLDAPLRIKLGYPRNRPKKAKYKVLVESDKLVSSDNDGVKRYQVELLRALFPVVENSDSRWDIDLHFHGQIRPLVDLKRVIFQDFVSIAQDNDTRPSALETTAHNPLSGSKKEEEEEEFIESIYKVSIFLRFERTLVGLVPRSVVHFLRRKNITIFHSIYEFFRAIVVRASDGLAVVKSHVQTGYQWTLSVFTKGAGRILEDSAEQEKVYDLVHLPLKQNFRAFEHDNTKKIITIHDLSHAHFPDHHTSINVENADLGMRFAADSGAHLIAISESTKADILADGSVPENRIHLIYEAADPVKFHRKTNKVDCYRVREKYGVGFPQAYIVCLSTIEPRKNLANTVKAFISLLEENHDLDLKLVIAGKRGWDADGVYASASDHQDNIFFTGFVDDDDLAYLYSDALALSYLSFHEGFGLPPLEAMRCGTPVIYGNNSSMIEVVGNAGLPADPYDLMDIKAQYLKIYRESELRESMSRAAIRRSVEFSWRDTAIETLNLYEKVINDQA